MDVADNVDGGISGDEIAQWYYWRWRIESFFELIKGAGHDVESWLQRSTDAVLWWLLIASMACVLVKCVGTKLGMPVV